MIYVKGSPTHPALVSVGEILFGVDVTGTERMITVAYVNDENVFDEYGYTLRDLRTAVPLDQAGIATRTEIGLALWTRGLDIDEIGL